MLPVEQGSTIQYITQTTKVFFTAHMMASCDISINSNFKGHISPCRLFWEGPPILNYQTSNISGKSVTWCLIVTIRKVRTPGNSSAVRFLREKEGGIILFIPKTHPGCNPQKEYITPPLFRVGKEPSGYISQVKDPLSTTLQHESIWPLEAKESVTSENPKNETLWRWKERNESRYNMSWLQKDV